MTEPNSLFSNMMITICAKFGTNGLGVTVAVGLGKGVVVGGGVRVGKGVTEALGGNAVGELVVWLPHATSASHSVRKQINNFKFICSLYPDTFFTHYTI